MRIRIAGVAAIVGALSLTAGAGQAAGRMQLSVTPKAVVAGGALTVRVSGVHRGACVLSIRADRRGSLVRYRRRIARGRSSIAIGGTAVAGPRIASVRCGTRSARARFSVLAALAKAAPAPGAVAPAIGPDEQGFVAGTAGSQEDVTGAGQLGGGSYPNSRIADIALSHMGQNLYTPGPLDHGQCKQAVNDWVAAASGGTQRMGVDYYSNYARNGGTQVARDDAMRGDIIQLDKPADIANYYPGMHTAVVLSHGAGSSSFDVVDANFRLDRIVRQHPYDPFQAAQKYGLRVTIWRMGTADGGAPPPPPPPSPPLPPPPPPPTHGETTGGATNTWTNFTNAGGTQGPTIPAYTSVQIACKLQGFRVADGNTWWYRIASDPWNGTYYSSADAFYNNGQTSGSLHGTPFFDPAVPDC